MPNSRPSWEETLHPNSLDPLTKVLVPPLPEAPLQVDLTDNRTRQPTDPTITATGIPPTDPIPIPRISQKRGEDTPFINQPRYVSRKCLL
jgi:hypothetical protein